MLFAKFVFADGESWEPQSRMIFDDGAPRRDLDLPGGPRVLRSLEFQFQGPPNVIRWKAMVELWGK
jgi:hypothetical protein